MIAPVKQILKTAHALLFPTVEEHRPTPLRTHLHTGATALDKATGIDGYPRGRIVELFGDESAGKTTLALHAISRAQANGETCAFIDADHTLDLAYARRLGVSFESLLVARPNMGEPTLRTTEALIGSGAFALIVVDSASSLAPSSDAGALPPPFRRPDRSLGRLIALTRTHDTTLLFTRHQHTQRSPRATHATIVHPLAFYASMRIEMRCADLIHRNRIPIGQRIVTRCVKSPVSSRLKETELEIRFGDGIVNTTR